MSKQAFKRMRRHLRQDVTRSPLDAFCWPGGYPIYYVCADGGTLCAHCVNAHIGEVDAETRAVRNAAHRGFALRGQWALAGSDVNYEDDTLACDHCDGGIEAAYEDEAESGRTFRCVRRANGTSERREVFTDANGRLWYKPTNGGRQRFLTHVEGEIYAEV